MSLLVLDAYPASADDSSIFVVGAFFGEFKSLVSEDGCDGFLMRVIGSGEVTWTRPWDLASLDGQV